MSHEAPAQIFVACYSFIACFIQQLSQVNSHLITIAQVNQSGVRAT